MHAHIELRHRRGFNRGEAGYGWKKSEPHVVQKCRSQSWPQRMEGKKTGILGQKNWGKEKRSSGEEKTAEGQGSRREEPQGAKVKKSHKAGKVYFTSGLM